MESVYHVGPVDIPLTLLVNLTVLLLGFAVSAYFSNQGFAEVRKHIWRIGLVAVVAARVGFVWGFRTGYLAAPLDILDIRDGGWDPQFGIVVAWGYTINLVRHHPGIRRPVLAGVAASSITWIVATVAILLYSSTQPYIPNLDLKSIDDSDVMLNSFQGRPTVINIWATWCPPCQREMPILQSAQEHHGDINVVLVNQGESARQVEGFLSRNHLNLKNVFLDPKGSAAGKFDISVYPTTLFFDASGRLVARHLGELSMAILSEGISIARGETKE